MTNATRRGRALGSGSIAVAVLLSACATTENGKVMEADMNLTRSQAQAKVIEYLTETIAVLPPGAYLTRYSELSKKSHSARVASSRATTAICRRTHPWTTA